MGRKVRKTLLGTVLTLLILLLCFGSGLLPLNLFFLKSTLTDAFFEQTGAVLAVDGPLRLRLGPRPVLTARQVTISWPGQSEMPDIDIRDLSIRSRLPSILRRQIDIPGATARDVHIRYGSPEISERLPTDLDFEISAPLDQPLSAEISGWAQGEAMNLTLGSASLTRLLSLDQDYPLNAALTFRGSAFQFDGTLFMSNASPEIGGHFSAQAENLSSVLALLGQEMPGLGSLSLETGIRANGAFAQLEQAAVRLDEFSFTASALLQDWSGRPRFELQADIPVLDPESLPSTGREEDRGEPVMEMDLQPLLDQLAQFDGQAEITIGQIPHGEYPLRDLLLSAILEQGQLRVDQARVKVVDTLISAEARLDATARCPALETEILVPESDLEAVLALLDEGSELTGLLEGGRIHTRSCGSSLADHLGNLETAFAFARLEVYSPDDPTPLHIENLDARINQLQAGKLSLNSELLGEPLSLAIEFGSLDQMDGDVPWRISLQAVTNSRELQFSGDVLHHETGLMVDLSLAVRLGGTDVQGELTWGGPETGMPLKAHFSSQRFDLRDIDALLPENNQDETGTLQDWGEILDETELIEDWLAIPSINVKLDVDRLEGTPYEVSAISLAAHLEDRKLEDGRMGLVFEGVEMDGLLNADMSAPAWLIDYKVTLKNLDIGRLMRSLELSDDVDAHVARADFHFNSEGRTLRDLGRNMHLQSRFRSLRWSNTAGPGDRKFDISLSDVKVLAHPTEDTVWETSGTLNGYPVQAWLRTPNLRQTFDENLPLPARFVFASRNDVTMVDFTAYPTTAAGQKFDIQLSGRYTSEETFDFASLPSPLEDYFFRTELTVQQGKYIASDIEAQIESSSATGRFSIEPDGQGYHFELDMDSTFLETDHLVLWAQEFREAREFVAAPDAADPDKAPISIGLLKIIDQYIDEFVGENVWNINVDIHELRSGGELLGETHFRLMLDGEELMLDPATIRMPGGNVDVRYSSQQANGGWDYNLDVYIERLEYGGLLRLFDPESTAEGVIHVDTSLHSWSADVEEIVDHLEGHFDLAAFPEDVAAAFLDLWASNLVFALLPFGDDENKKLNCIVARFAVDKGVMKSSTTFLDSTEIIVHARGEIDLANRQLDLIAAPQAKREKFLSVSTPVEVTGPFDNFNVDLAPGGFIMTMFRWYYGLIYVPWKWLTGKRFPEDGIETCYSAMDWEVPTEAR